MYNINGVRKTFGNVKVLDGIDINIKENIVTCIIGPSGCGKTTLFNIIAGIEKPDDNFINEFDKENISYLFQEPRLLKWKKVEENISFVLKGKMKDEKIKDLVNRYLELVNLKEYKNYYPNKLSGGMKQRVAIARAFAYPSKILLMDEPFKSLDYELRMGLIDDFRSIQEAEKRTVIFITHDITAAALLGDEIMIMSDKPTKIKQTIINDIIKSDRDIRNDKIRLLEKRLIDIISNKSV